MHRLISILFFPFLIAVNHSNSLLSKKLLDIYTPQLLKTYSLLNDEKYSLILRSFNKKEFLYQLAHKLEEKALTIFTFYAFKTMSTREAVRLLSKPDSEVINTLLNAVEQFF